MSIYGLTSTFLGLWQGEEQEGQFLGRSICCRSDGLTWIGDVKLVNEAFQEWNMSSSSEVQTLGMIFEHDVKCQKNAEFLCTEEATQYQRTAAKLNFLST